MTTKLGRYIFKRIGGRVIPIRIGAEATTSAKNFSMSALRKLQGSINKKNAEIAAKFTEHSVVKSKVFHGTNAKFKKFNHDKIGSSTGTALGRGFYFTDKKTTAKAYGSKVKEYFLSIKRPLFGSLNDGFKANDITEKQVEKIVKGQDLSNWGERSTSKSVAEQIQKYNTNDLDKVQDIGTTVFNNNWKKALSKVRKITGIDGSVAGNKEVIHYVAFNSDQIMEAPKKSTIYKDQLKKLKNFQARKNK
jgi:hypothetical protein